MTKRAKNTERGPRVASGVAKFVVGASVVAGALPFAASPAAAWSIFGYQANSYELVVCAQAGPIKCGQAQTSASAATSDTSNNFAGVMNDGMRGNAFKHSSWNARMAVVMSDRGWAHSFSLAHEKPLTSSNPAGTNLTNRNERMDLCNNMRGFNRPSNTQMAFFDQMTAVNQLKDEARGMVEHGAEPEALLSNEACDYKILVFIRKNDGTWMS